MVMEASPSPSPQSVGREFVRQYYTLLNKAPAHLHRFYNNYSSFVHGGLDAVGRETPPVIGQKQIHHRIQQLNFRDCHAKISQVDSQATLGNGVVVQVSGELSNGGAPMRRFTQTFVLAAQSPKKYYVHNDIFRYQDIVFSDSEGSGSGRSEGEEEEGPYFPPAPFPPPPALPAPPVPPPAAPAPPPAAPAAGAGHLNGLPPAEDANRHLAQAMQGASLSSVEPEERVEEPEPAAEPEPALEPPPPQPQPPVQPQAPAVVAPPEPKTYANLLKSGAGVSGGPVPSGPAPLPPRPEPAPERPRLGAPRQERERERERERDREREPQPSAGPAGEGAAGGGAGAGSTGPGSRRYSDAQQLFLGNVPHGASEAALRALFQRFGPLHELRLLAKPSPPGGRGHPNYGFITFESAAGALACLRAAPLYFPPDAPDAVKLNVEEKKRREPRRRPVSGGRYRQPPPAAPPSTRR